MKQGFQADTRNSLETLAWFKLIKAYYAGHVSGKYKNLDSDKILNLLLKGSFQEGEIKEFGSQMIGTVSPAPTSPTIVAKEFQEHAKAGPQVESEKTEEVLDWKNRFELLKELTFVGLIEEKRVEFSLTFKPGVGTKSSSISQKIIGKQGQPRKLDIASTYRNIRDQVFEVVGGEIPPGFFQGEDVIVVPSTAILNNPGNPNTTSKKPDLLSVQEGHLFYNLPLEGVAAPEKKRDIPVFSTDEIHHYAYLTSLQGISLQLFESGEHLGSFKAFVIEHVEFNKEYDQLLVSVKEGEHSKILSVSDVIDLMKCEFLHAEDLNFQYVSSRINSKNPPANSQNSKKRVDGNLLNFLNQNSVWLVGGKVNNPSNLQDDRVRPPVNLKNFTISDAGLYMEVNGKVYDKLETSKILNFLNTKQIQILTDNTYRKSVQDEMLGRAFKEIPYISYLAKKKDKRGDAPVKIEYQF